MFTAVFEISFNMSSMSVCILRVVMLYLGRKNIIMASGKVKESPKDKQLCLKIKGAKRNSDLYSSEAGKGCLLKMSI